MLVMLGVRSHKYDKKIISPQSKEKQCHKQWHFFTIVLHGNSFSS